MTSDQIFLRISQLSGQSISNVIQFCRNNMIAAINLNEFYTSIGRMPTQEECAKIRQSGASYIKTLNNG